MSAVFYVGIFSLGNRAHIISDLAMFRETAEAFTTARYQAPKTVLGFFAIVLAILVTGVAAVVAILARNSTVTYLIVPILVFAGIVVIGVLVGVFVTAWKDPTILMLGQVSGEIFVENRRLKLGDSVAGEQTVVIEATADAVVAPKRPAESGGES